jgi:hypothetical protein
VAAQALFQGPDRSEHPNSVVCVLHLEILSPFQGGQRCFLKSIRMPGDGTPKLVHAWQVIRNINHRFIVFQQADQLEVGYPPAQPLRRLDLGHFAESMGLKARYVVPVFYVAKSRHIDEVNQAVFMQFQKAFYGFLFLVAIVLPECRGLTLVAHGIRAEILPIHGGKRNGLDFGKL